MDEKRKKFSITLGDIVPIIAFVVIFIFFAIASKGKLLNAYNMKLLVDQSIQIIILACGMVFVIAQGSIDLSVGVNLGLAAILSTNIAVASGHSWLLFPLAVIIGTLVGVLNGFLVSTLKVPSFMVSIAMLMGIRGLNSYLFTIFSTTQVPKELKWFNNGGVKFTVFIIILVVVYYLLEYSRIGRYSKAIGENEETARNVGIPIRKMKWIVFIISGFMAGVAAIFSLFSVGGTSNQMGAFSEMKTAMAIFFGGILVTGGYSAKFYKFILGSLSITLIVVGLALIGFSATEYSETIEGILLLAILLITILANKRKQKARDEEETLASKIPEKTE